MSRKTVLITGGNGAVGQALCMGFKKSGWRVISTDQGKVSAIEIDDYVSMDLTRLCSDDVYQEEVLGSLRSKLYGGKLDVLINNAAVQMVSSVEVMTVQDFKTTLDVNLIAPFFLIKLFLTELQKTKGSIINIASIHAQLTKPHFTAYATSKAALVGMTRSMAVELGEKVRVNAINPAAISSAMLEAGFRDDPQGLHELESFHPSGCLGATDDVVEAALYLANAKGKFLNGSIIGLDGGIASRLHDPS